MAEQALPDYNKNLPLTGLKDTVNVSRDSLGIPHIYATNKLDLYRASGYLMAQDRMWQMDLLRRVTMGRLSEIFGKDYVEADMLFRSLKITEKSKRVLDSISPQLKQLLKAYSDGINQYIANHKENLPLEFSLLAYKPEKWKPIHTMNLTGYMGWNLSGAWESEMILYKLKNKIDSSRYYDLIPDMKLFDTPVYQAQNSKISKKFADNNLLASASKLEGLGVDIFTGSNNWAVSGKKSANGNAMLANDMHLELNSPGIWYQMHQTIKGEVNVTGVALPGAPFIIDGHNSNIAWGMTNVMLDDIDFYRETLHPDTNAKYKFNGKWRDMKVQKEKIRISKDEVVDTTLKFTHRGPVISGFKGTDAAISMHWIGNEYSNEIKSIYELNYAKNWEDFKNALRTFRAISQNVNYADKQGNIGMYTCAGVPKRETPGWQIFPGDTGRYDWDAYVPFDSLPHSYNPERGFVYSANNKITNDDYPHYISYWYDLPYRAKRIKEQLASKEKVTVTDFKALQTDHYSKLAEKMVPVVLNTLRNDENLNKREQSALNNLKNWNFIMDKNSSAAAIFDQLFIKLSENIFIDEMGDSLYTEYVNLDFMPNYVIDKLVKGQSSQWCDDISTPKEQENFEDMITKSFKETVQTLTQKMGKNTETWKWGKIHTFTVKHPLSEVEIIDKIFDLNHGPYPAGGSFHTVSPNSYDFDDPFSVSHTASQRHIFTTSDWDNSLSIIPTGISGIATSPHYCDQTKTYINKKYHQDLFSKQKVQKHQKYKMKFMPE